MTPNYTVDQTLTCLKPYSGIINPVFDGLTYNLHRHFARCSRTIGRNTSCDVAITGEYQCKNI